MTKPTLYTWGTPNGLKPLLMLEELGAEYELVKVNIGKNEQKTPEYLAKNLNGRIPVLETNIDGETVEIAESAAILIHLAETHGNRFFSTKAAERASILQWSFFQMGAVGPMFGQLGFFKRNQADNERAIKRYSDESERIYGVLNTRLGQAPWLAGENYSLADMLTFFWSRKPEMFGFSLDTWPNVKRWVETMSARPAVQKTLAVTFP